MQYESTLERDFLIRKEWSLAVLDVIPQPCQIPFVARSGQTYTYTPDFLVYYRLGNRTYGDYPKPLLVEVKPKAEWRKHWREWMPKWKAAQRLARVQGVVASQPAGQVCVDCRHNGATDLRRNGATKNGSIRGSNRV